MGKRFITTLILFLAILGILSAQQSTITGVVTTAEDGAPLPGVTVVVAGTSIGTITTGDGRYSITIPSDSKALNFSFIGMAPQTINIGNSSIIDVVLETSTEALDEVVVTALGIRKEKKALGYSVQEVSGSSLVEARETNIANSLKGKVAGVFVNSSSGGPQGSSYVLIRGNSSIAGSSQPLYVVDGIPISNDNLNMENSLGSGKDFGDGIKDINPDDIESISVLKGPNAAVLYGARGANGVIMITTKRSNKKTLGVSFNSNLTMETINTLPTFQNKYGIGWDDTDETTWSTKVVDGVTYPTPPNQIDAWGPAFDGRIMWVPGYSEVVGPIPFTAQPKDNIGDFYRTGRTFTNTVAISGGTDKTNFRVSLSNLDTKGIIPNNTFEKTTANILFGADVTDKLHVEAKANYIYEIGKNIPTKGVSSSSALPEALGLVPRHVDLDLLEANYRDVNGNYVNYMLRATPINPYWLLYETSSESRRNRLIGFISVSYEITNWLKIQGRTGIDTYTETQKQQYNVGSPVTAYKPGRIQLDQYHISEINSDVLLSAQGKLSEKFTGSLSFGASRYGRRWEKVDQVGTGLDIPDLYIIENTTAVTTSYDLVRKKIQSVYSTGQLAYKNYLFLDLNARNDWSSTLGVNNQSYFYPAVSLSGVITDAFNIQSDVLSFAKVRASYAQAGNDTQPYQTTAGYNVETNYFKGIRYGSIKGALPPVDLKNELKTSYEFGADFRLLKNRIGIDFTYYNSNTTNQIFDVQISSASGYGSLRGNAGKMSNKGIELFVTVVPVEIPNSLKWEMSLNFSKNKSRVVSLAEGLETYTILSNGNARIEARPGHPYGDIIGYSYKTDSLGNRVVNGILGKDGAGQFYSRSDEKGVIGNVQPDWLGGINNTFSYKGFELSALVDIRWGGDMFSWSKYDGFGHGTSKLTENRDNLVIEGVIDDGTGNYVPSSQIVTGQNYYGQRNWQNIGEEFVLDATYVALREATLSYSFNKELLSKTPIKTAKISLVGRNLFYIYRDSQFKKMGISPETAFAPTAKAQGYEAFSMPTTRSIGFNLALTF